MPATHPIATADDQLSPCRVREGISDDLTECTDASSRIGGCQREFAGQAPIRAGCWRLSREHRYCFSNATRPTTDPSAVAWGGFAAIREMIDEHCCVSKIVKTICLRCEDQCILSLAEASPVSAIASKNGPGPVWDLEMTATPRWSRSDIRGLLPVHVSVPAPPRQPRVLDGDDGLVGEASQQSDLPLSEHAARCLRCNVITPIGVPSASVARPIGCDILRSSQPRSPRIQDQSTRRELETVLPSSTARPAIRTPPHRERIAFH